MWDFIISSVIIFLGFIGVMLFKVFSIPEIIFLILFGIFLGPIFNFFNFSNISSVLPYFTCFAIAVLMFDSGLRLKIERLFENSKLIYLSLLSFIFSFSVISILFKFLFNFRWAISLAFGALFGGCGNTVLLTLLRSMNIKEESLTYFSFELAFSNILSFIVALSSLNYLSMGVVKIVESLKMLFTQFSAGMMVGGLIGVLWLIIIYAIRREEYFYILTLAILIAAYSFAEGMDGSGPLASLIFGFIIGNYERVGRIFGFKFDVHEVGSIRYLLGGLHSEITFLIRVFFFVILGLSFTVASSFEFLFGLLITLLLFLGRFFVMLPLTIKREFSYEKYFFYLNVGRGLATAVLSFIISSQLSDLSNFILNLSIYVLIFSNLLMSVLVKLTLRELTPVVSVK